MNKFITTDNFTQRAEISKVETLADSFHLKFTTQLLGTRFPYERHTPFATTLSREQLTKLRDIISLHLLETT
jgi:hypothetical protein